MAKMVLWLECYLGLGCNINTVEGNEWKSLCKEIWSKKINI